MGQSTILALGQTAATSTDVVVASGAYVTVGLFNGDLATPTAAAFSTASTGGSLVPATYYYRVSAINAFGETLAFTEASQVVGAGTNTNTVTVNWLTVTGATGYKVYGRTTGAELLIATVGAVLTYVDTGAITPAGALPAANTTSPGLTPNARAVVYIDTPGTDQVYANLYGAQPRLVLGPAPGTYRITRPDLSADGINVGVFKEV
jgi:hypothetical protein